MLYDANRHRIYSISFHLLNVQKQPKPINTYFKDIYTYNKNVKKNHRIISTKNSVTSDGDRMY